MLALKKDNAPNMHYLLLQDFKKKIIKKGN